MITKEPIIEIEQPDEWASCSNPQHYSDLIAWKWCRACEGKRGEQVNQNNEKRNNN